MRDSGKIKNKRRPDAATYYPRPSTVRNKPPRTPSLLKREDAEVVSKEEEKSVLTSKKHPLNSPKQRNQVP